MVQQTHILLALVCVAALASPSVGVVVSFLDQYEASGGTNGYKIYYDGPNNRYRQDVIAYGSDTTIMMAFCDQDNKMKQYSLSYPGQPHGPFNPSGFSDCSYKVVSNVSCGDAFNTLFTVPRFKNPYSFNPLYMPLAAPIRRGVPDNFKLTGHTPCPTASSKPCLLYNYSEPVPLCSGDVSTSYYAVDVATKFPIAYAWNPVFSNQGICESYSDSAVYELVSTTPPPTSKIEDFAAKVPVAKCRT